MDDSIGNLLRSVFRWQLNFSYHYKFRVIQCFVYRVVTRSHGINQMIYSFIVYRDNDLDLSGTWLFINNTLKKPKPTNGIIQFFSETMHTQFSDTRIYASIQSGKQSTRFATTKVSLDVDWVVLIVVRFACQDVVGYASCHPAHGLNRKTSICLPENHAHQNKANSWPIQ